MIQPFLTGRSRNDAVRSGAVIGSNSWGDDTQGAYDLSAAEFDALVRDADGTFYVLEDNLRVPSGVSYLLENRMVAKRVLPELFRSYSIEPVDSYIGKLSSLLSSLAP